MRTSSTIVMTAAACSLALVTSALAQAPTRCPEGRAISGECVNPGLAIGARKSVLAYTQPKFSYTAPARLPVEDRDNPISPVWHELLQIFYYPPVSPTNPKP
jgi:hypothetical protein